MRSCQGTAFEANAFFSVTSTLRATPYDNNGNPTVKGQLNYAVYYDLDDTPLGDFGFQVKRRRK